MPYPDFHPGGPARFHFSKHIGASVSFSSCFIGAFESNESNLPSFLQPFR